MGRRDESYEEIQSASGDDRHYVPVSEIRRRLMLENNTIGNTNPLRRMLSEIGMESQSEVQNHVRQCNAAKINGQDHGPNMAAALGLVSMLSFALYFVWRKFRGSKRITMS